LFSNSSYYHPPPFQRSFTDMGFCANLEPTLSPTSAYPSSPSQSSRSPKFHGTHSSRFPFSPIPNHSFSPTSRHGFCATPRNQFPTTPGFDFDSPTGLPHEPELPSSNYVWKEITVMKYVDADQHVRQYGLRGDDTLTIYVNSPKQLHKIFEALDFLEGYPAYPYPSIKIEHISVPESYKNECLQTKRVSVFIKFQNECMVRSALAIFRENRQFRKCDVKCESENSDSFHVDSRGGVTFN